VAGAHLLVELVGVGVGDEVGGQADLGERRGDDHVGVGLAARVDPGAEGVVERLDDLLAVQLAGRRHEARVAEHPGEVRLVLVADVVVLVQHGEAHDVERHVEVAVAGDLVDPAAGHPGPGAGGVEPEVDGGVGRGGDGVGHALSEHLPADTSRWTPRRRGPV
jgi:hypothetical protein